MALVAWLSDVHLNFLRSNRDVEAVGRRVAAELREYVRTPLSDAPADRVLGAPNSHHLASPQPSSPLLSYRYDDASQDIVLITGDIGEADNWAEKLKAFAVGLREEACTGIFFVLGNHDAYGGSIAGMLETAEKMTGHGATWLTKQGVVGLASDTALIGHDGWYDGRYGVPEASDVVLNDFLLIEELTLGGRRGERLRRPQLLTKLRAMADRFAEEARPTLEKAVTSYRHVFFATHVPPFVGAAWHEGQISDKHWLPWMTNKAMGDMLMDVAQAHPETDITVLCGHTHSAGEYQALPNLRVLTAAASYGNPKVHQIFEVP